MRKRSGERESKARRCGESHDPRREDRTVILCSACVTYVYRLCWYNVRLSVCACVYVYAPSAKRTPYFFGGTTETEDQEDKGQSRTDDRNT